MPEVPSRPTPGDISTPSAHRVERWVLHGWILAIVVALLWALLH